MINRGLVILLTACVTLPAQVQFEDILKSPGEHWLTYTGSYNGWRYASGRQITSQNVGSVVPKWVYHVSGARSLQTTPIVYDGVMYVTSANSIHALDVRTGRLVWKYSDTRAERQGTNRGVAILGDRVYGTSADNYLTALDRRTGAVIFSKRFADASTGKLVHRARVCCQGQSDCRLQCGIGELERTRGLDAKHDLALLRLLRLDCSTPAPNPLSFESCAKSLNRMYRNLLELLEL